MAFTNNRLILDSRAQQSRELLLHVEKSKEIGAFFVVKIHENVYVTFLVLFISCRRTKQICFFNGLIFEVIGGNLCYLFHNLNIW